MKIYIFLHTPPTQYDNRGGEDCVVLCVGKVDQYVIGISGLENCTECDRYKNYYTHRFESFES